MSCYFKIEKVTYHVLMEIMSATIDFNFFSFQIRVNYAVVGPVHYSSFGPSPLTCQLESSASVMAWMPHHSHSCLRSPQRVMLEGSSPLTFLSKGILSSAYRNNECHYWLQFFLFRLENHEVSYAGYCITFGLSLHWFVNFNHQFFNLHINFAKYSDLKNACEKQIIFCLLACLFCIK